MKTWLPDSWIEIYIERAKKGKTLTAPMSLDLARALKEERAERKNNPGVWDGAPDMANECTVYFARKDGKISDSFRTNKTYTRELPKTKARAIAERKAREWQDGLPIDSDPLADLIEAAILEAQKEVAK